MITGLLTEKITSTFLYQELTAADLFNFLDGNVQPVHIDGKNFQVSHIFIYPGRVLDATGGSTSESNKN